MTVSEGHCKTKVSREACEPECPQYPAPWGGVLYSQENRLMTQVPFLAIKR